MNTTRIRRTVRMSVVSLLFVLVAVSFLTVGSASAQSTSQSYLSQASSLSPQLKSCHSNVVHIVLVKNFGTGFSCHSMTVKVGAPVVFVNTTIFRRFVVYNENSFLSVSPHSRAEFFTTQPGQIPVFIYDDPHDPQTQLFVTVVS